jgi:hypothetical protein
MSYYYLQTLNSNLWWVVKLQIILLDVHSQLLPLIELELLRQGTPHLLGLITNIINIRSNLYVMDLCYIVKANLHIVQCF